MSPPAAPHSFNQGLAKLFRVISIVSNFDRKQNMTDLTAVPTVNVELVGVREMSPPG